jgi:hypothetical protein
MSNEPGNIYACTCSSYLKAWGELHLYLTYRGMCQWTGYVWSLGLLSDIQSSNLDSNLEDHNFE